jgi:hypothetical protein
MVPDAIHQRRAGRNIRLDLFPVQIKFNFQCSILNA